MDWCSRQGSRRREDTYFLMVCSRVKPVASRPKNVVVVSTAASPCFHHYVADFVGIAETIAESPRNTVRVVPGILLCSGGSSSRRWRKRTTTERIEGESSYPKEYSARSVNCAWRESSDLRIHLRVGQVSTELPMPTEPNRTATFCCGVGDNPVSLHSSLCHLSEEIWRREQ